MGNRTKKSDLRKIIVNDKLYYWNVSDYNCDGDGGCKFQIWYDKEVIFKEIIHNDTITPKNVREQILKINEIIHNI